HRRVLERRQLGQGRRGLRRRLLTRFPRPTPSASGPTRCPRRSEPAVRRVRVHGFSVVRPAAVASPGLLASTTGFRRGGRPTAAVRTRYPPTDAPETILVRKAAGAAAFRTKLISGATG